MKKEELLKLFRNINPDFPVDIITIIRDYTREDCQELLKNVKKKETELVMAQKKLTKHFIKNLTLDQDSYYSESDIYINYNGHGFNFYLEPDMLEDSANFYWELTSISDYFTIGDTRLYLDEELIENLRLKIISLFDHNVRIVRGCIETYPKEKNNN